MTSPRSNWLCWCTLVLLPLVWLWPSVFGGKTFVPFDPAQFPPAALTLSAAELETARADANHDVTEIWPWLLPEMQLAQDEVANGNLPTWDPHSRTGAPLHEVGVLGVFYPPHWLWLFGGDPKEWLVYLTWISLALAGVFTFGLLRKVELSPLAAWFGAVTFQLSGPMAANGFFFTRLPALAWLPGLLWALMCLADGKRTRPWPLTAVALGVAMPWLAGFPPYAAAGLLIGAALAIRLVLERAGREGARSGRELTVRLALGIGLGVLLTLPQLLPQVWFYVSEAARSADPTLDHLSGTRFDGYGLLGYLMPDAFGHPINQDNLPYALNALTYLWCNRGLSPDGYGIPPNYNYTEYSVYAGTLALLLGALGLVRGRGHMRGFVAVMLALLLGLALFLPVVNWLYYLPLAKQVPALRWLAPASLFVAWMAAIGFERLRSATASVPTGLAVAALALAAAAFFGSRLPHAWHTADLMWPATELVELYPRVDDANPTPPVDDIVKHFCGDPPEVDRFAKATARFAAAGEDAAYWLLIAAALLGACALLRDRRARPWALGSLPLLSVIQLGLHGAAILPGQRLEHRTDTAVHDFLRRQATIHQDDGGFTFARAVRDGGHISWATDLPPGQLMAKGIRDLNFYSHGDRRSIEALRRLLAPPAEPSTAAAKRYARIPEGHSYFARTLPEWVLAHPLFDLLGVRYVLATQPLTDTTPPVGQRTGPRDGPLAKFYVYERPNPLPRAFTIAALRQLDTDDEVLDALIDPQANFARTALVAADAPPDAAISAPITTNPRPVRFTRDEPSVVELDIGGGDDPWLVMSDAFFPGWTATIDGVTADIGRCNHAMRLLRLPANACKVRLEYRSTLLPYGIALFLFGAAGLLLPFVLRGRSSAVRPRDETAE